MSAQHTPGPWSKSRSTALAIVAPSGQIIADVGHARDMLPIMAVPELLAAVRQLLDSDVGCYLDPRARKAGQDAIAKATGSAS